MQIATDWREILEKRRGMKSPGLVRPGKSGGRALLDLPATDPSVDVATRSAWATISTNTPDRSEDIVEPSGVLLDNYRKNPVILWDHGFGGINLPIGKCEDADGNLAMQITDDRIDAGCFFAGTAEAEQVFELVREKIVRATSIGFRPLEAEPRSSGWDRPGLHITLWEILEWSWVIVPDNPDALAKVLDRGKLAGRPICAPLVKSLSAVCPPRQIYGKGWRSPATGRTIEQCRALVGRGQKSALPPEAQRAVDEFVGIAEQAMTAIVSRLVSDLRDVVGDLRNAVAERQNDTAAEGEPQPGQTAYPAPWEAEPRPDPRLGY